MLSIRAAGAADWPALWSILEPIAREGETFALDRNIGEAEGRAYWLSPDKTNFVATDGGVVLGSSYIRPNQSGGGRHVANCGYMSAPLARGRGIARALCAHSIDWAREAGFVAIQFNFVIASNAPAVHLWTSFGFRILCRLPGAFRHPRLGPVDALVMWLDL